MKKTGQVIRSDDRRKMRRIYLTQDEYQLLFNAAWYKRKFSPNILDANQLIVENCVAHAKKDLED